MNGKFRVDNVICNVNKGKFLFHTIIDKVIKDLQHIKIYDVSKQDFIDSIFLYDKLCEVIISYVNHNVYQDGVIICFYPGKNEIYIFLNNEGVGFKLFGNAEFSCFAFEANDYLCASNLNNQILLLQWQSKETQVFYHFHISNHNTLATMNVAKRVFHFFVMKQEMRHV